MSTKDLDCRDLWRKLLDPIREWYAEDIVSDLELLRQVVHDLQSTRCENERLGRTVQKQARLLRREGIGGY